MNEKFTNFKKKVKHHTPEIIVATILVAGVAALIHLKNYEADEILLSLSPEEWAKVNSGDAVRLLTDVGPIAIAKEIHLP